MGMMEKPTINAVIFDQDGLMFDTERMSEGIWYRVADELGIPIYDELLASIRGMNADDSYGLFREYYGDTVDIRAFRERKREVFLREVREKGVLVKPGLRKLLVWLREHGYRMAVATASREEYTRRNLEETGISEYFAAVTNCDMVKHAKPDPELFLKAAQMLNEKPEHCLVLEDSRKGLEAGLRGGFVTVMVPDIWQPTEELRGRLYRVCRSLDEVIPLLEELR